MVTARIYSHAAILVLNSGECMKKYLVLCMFFCAAGVLCAEHRHWQPVTAERLWSQGSNWSDGTAPGTGDFAWINVDGSACVVDSVVNVDQFSVGSGNVGQLVIANGGQLTTTGWCGNGDGDGTSVGTVTVEAGGTLNLGDHFWTGHSSGDVGTTIINGGIVNVGHQLGLGWDGGTGYMYVNSGTLNLANWSDQTISSTSVLDISEGTVIINGNQTASIASFVAAGRITGYGGAGQVFYDYDVTYPGKTTITAEQLTGPAVPTGLSAVAGDGFVSLDWADNTQGDWAGYRVYRSTTSGSYGTALATGVLDSIYVDNTVSNGTVYYYVVTAVDTSDDESAQSDEVSVIPGAVSIKVEAESYVEMSGIQTENTSDIGGGQNLGFIDSGDWADYTIDLPVSGVYRISFRVASDRAEGSRAGIINILEGGETSVGTIDVLGTAGWQTWTTISRYVTFSASGVQTLRVEFFAGGFNFNWFELIKANPVLGDLNTDTIVDILDLRILADQWLSSNCESIANQDQWCTVDLRDLSVLLLNWEEGTVQNPFITHMYTADPSAHVWDDGRLYVYPSHDIAPPIGCDLMDKYHVFSTDDMIHWTDHGEILSSDDVPWGRPEGGFMWAPDCAYKNGTYYYYFPHPSETEWNNTWKIGVATSDKPASDFVVQGYIPGLESHIDPCVFIDDDGQAYFYYGGGGVCKGGKLKDNMVEIDGQMQDMVELPNFHEGTWVFKRNNHYYLMYPGLNLGNGDHMLYAMSNNPLGPWDYQGVVLDPTGCDTSHGSVVEYKGQWYLFYHNAYLSGGVGNLRSICVDKLYFNADGTMQKVIQTGSE